MHRNSDFANLEVSMTYSERVIAELHERYADQPEFIQAADEVLTG